MSPLGQMTLWTGFDVRGTGSAASQAAEAFARSTSDAGPGQDRYELIAVAARGFRPPRFLSASDLPEGSADEQPVAAGPGAQGSREGLRESWSLLYRRVAESSVTMIVPYAIYLLGVNPPADATAEELGVFNDFYTNVHLPEVAKRRRALRATRYELVRALRPSYQGAPRYLAVYELDEAAASVRRHVGPPYAAGPEVWQRHSTPWRLWYRRLGAGDGAGERT